MTRPGRLTTQNLVDLVLDPRDPGYEAAAQRAGGRPRRHWYDQPLIAAGALVVGFVLALAWVHAHRSAPAAAKAHQHLVGQVRAAEHTADRLAGREAALSAQLDKLRGAALPGGSALARELRRQQLLAGTVATVGPGVEVRLAEPSMTSPATDAAGHASRGPAPVSHILVDRDVRSVVNQLWSDGAEAIDVNGLRLTPTSAIRFAGDAVLVDFQPINSPYVVDAIGDPGALLTGFAASDVASRYQTLASARGIGFSFAEKSQLDLPASPGTSLRYARVPR